MTYFLMSILALAAPGPSLELRLACAEPNAFVGQPLRLTLTIANRSKRAVVVDNGGLTSFTVVENPDGTAIPQWPFMDILSDAPGKEAYWKIKPGQVVTLPLSIEFARKTWSGFGIPSGTYQGIALEVHHQHGAAIHALASLPATIILKQRWISDATTVHNRAKKTRIRGAWAGSLASSPVTVQLAEGRTVLRIAVPNPRRPDDLFTATRSMVLALEKAGLRVIGVEGLATQGLRIQGNPEALARHGATLEQVAGALRQVVPAPAFASMQVAPSTHSLDLVFQERHWDPQRRVDQALVEAIGNAMVGTVPLRALASLHVTPGTSHARHGQLPVLLIQIASPHPKLDEVVRRLRDDHPEATVEQLANSTGEGLPR